MTASISGTAVTAPGHFVTDAAGAQLWLMKSVKSGLQIMRNGKLDATTRNVTVLFIWNGVAFQRNAFGGCWSWAGTSPWPWKAATDPRSAPVAKPPAIYPESVAGTVITAPGHMITDAAGVGWKLMSSTTSGLQIARDNKIDTTTANVALVRYDNHVIRQQNKAGGWWLWNGAWRNSSDPTAPPVAVPPVVTPPVATPPVTTPTTTPATSSGQVVTSSFITVDFGAPTGRQAPAALWGLASAAMQNNDFALAGDEQFLGPMSQIMPALFRLNSNAGEGCTGSGYWSDAIFAKGVTNPNWGVIAKFVQNAHRFISPTCRLIIGARIDAMSQADYGIAVSQLVKHLQSSTGGDGRPFPKIWGIEVGNENDGTDITTYLGYAKAAANAVQFDPSIQIIGTVDSYMHADRISALAKSGIKVGAFCYHNYAYGAGPGVTPPTDAQLLSNSRPADDARACRSAAGSNSAPIFMGEYNQDFNAQNEQRQQQPIGAVFVAKWMLDGFQTGAGVEMGAMWEAFGDGAYGATMPGQVMPTGAFLGRASATMGGTEVKVTSGNSNLRVLAVATDPFSPAFSSDYGGGIGVMIINTDTSGKAASGPIALSRWAGSGPLQRWEMSDASQGGVTQIPVSGGMANIVLPSKSVVILSA